MDSDSDYVPSNEEITEEEVEEEYEEEIEYEEEVEEEVEEEEEIEEEDDYNPNFDGIDELQLSLLKKENPKLYEKFLEIREYLVNDFPKIDVVLNANMYMKDKARIIEIFEIFCVSEPLTMEWLELKTQIKEMTACATAKYTCDKSIDSELRTKLKEELRQIKSMDTACTEYRIALLDIPVEYKSLLYKRYQTLQTTSTQNDEYGKMSDWIDTILKIPFGIYMKITGEHIIMNLKRKLDDEFYGLDSVKEQILIYVSNKLNNPEMKNYPLGLVGSPGCGKTSIALAMSKCLNIPFHQLSGGGLVSSDGIHGHSYTYVGSQPGDITKSLIRMKCMNGILFIDEFDKIPLEKSLNSILQLIDPVQNHNFKDNYVGDIPIDLSHIWYMLSMNKMPENQALQDRVFPITLSAYSHQQKFKILQQHTLPKMLIESKLDIQFEDDVLHHIVRSTIGDGMRQCIHMLKDIVCKVLFLKHHPDMDMSFRVDIIDTVKMSMMSKLMKTNELPFNTMYA